MKARHAAALTLVGWYLIAPSGKFASDATGGLIPTGWLRLGTYETEAQCDQARQAVKAKVAAAYAKQQKSGLKFTFQIGDDAECDDATLTPALSRWPEYKPK